MPIATRLTNTGTLLVNGSFDENTSITPAKFRTTSTTVSAGTLDEVSLPAGAVSFNGSSTYLSVPYSSNFNFGSEDFTIEFWMYTSSSGNSTKGLMAFSHNAGNFAQALWYFPTASTISFWCSSDGTSWDVANNVAAGTFALNTWYHVAVSRSGSTIRLFFNGVLQNVIAFAGTLAGTYDRNWIGATSSNGYYNGLLSNIRVVKGTAVYTANFTPPQAILPAITNTQLLLNVTDSANFVKDNSTSNLTVTNNGPATWNATGPFNQGSTTTKQRQINDGTLEVYTQFDEFTGAPVVDSSLVLWLDSGQTASYPGSGTTWYDLSSAARNTTLTNGPTYSSQTGGQIVLDGTDDYANFPSPSPMAGTNLFTYEIWVNFTTISGAFGGTNKAAFLFCGGTGAGTGQPEFYILSANNSSTTPSILNFGRGGGGTTGTLSIDVSASIANGNWYQIVLARTGSASQIVYLNGVQIGTGTVSNSFSDGQTDIGGIHGNAGYPGWLNGKIVSVKIYNRALTADEVTTNFNALRGRFGI